MHISPSYCRAADKLPGKVSVIVVCYNETPQDIHYTLSSIVNQDYSDAELVVVDGGSQKETITALSSYSSAITHFISEADNGVYDAMNKGLELATGEWVNFMNIGDRFHSTDVLSSMLRKSNLKEHPDLIYGDVMVCDAFRTKRLERMPKRIRRWFLYHKMICHQVVLVRRKTFEKIGMFNSSYRILSDRDWLIRFVEAGFSYIHSGVVVCDWRPGGISSDWIRADREWKEIASLRFSKFERILYATFWLLIRIWLRLRTGNLAMPARWCRRRNSYLAGEDAPG